ncbi:DUF4440 domain-containing protein [Actinoplanes sp. NPDC023714]|uniref:DUF4440 domain-containing protein n=1 Tax=Actinoplanes sp. NPDC023714 TaxID=3154322 RepID=UPI0033D9FBB1
MTAQNPLTAAPFTPTADDTASLMAWFDRYDALVRRHDVEAMADMARFPLTVMTSDSAGEYVTQQWDRATFVQTMDAGAGDLNLDNQRRPFFLNHDIAVVVTDTTVTAVGEEVRHMRYVDVMAKTGGEWRFTSMIQGGWGDMLKQYLGA